LTTTAPMISGVLVRRLRRCWFTDWARVATVPP
jgi:hypothetical protein